MQTAFVHKAPFSLYSNYQTVISWPRQTLISNNTKVSLVCSNITVKWRNLLRQLEN